MKRIVLSAIILGCGLSAIISFAAEKQNVQRARRMECENPVAANQFRVRRGRTRRQDLRDRRLSSGS